MSHLPKSKYILIAILAVIAVILAYNIYNQTGLRQIPAVSTDSSKGTEGTQPTSTSSSTTNEGSTLNFPGPNASDAEKRQFAELINQKAQAAETLIIDKCEPNPVVVKVQLGSNLKISNNDSVTHKIIINPDYQFEVKAKSSIAIKNDFGKGEGIYGFRCDQENSPNIGIFLVTP